MNARYDFWHERKWEIAVGSGLMYEHELWDYEGVDSAKIPLHPVNQVSEAIKSNTYVKWEGKVSTGSTVSAVVFYQATFASFFEPRIAGSFKFTAEISRRLLFGVTFQGLYDAKPVVPIFHFYYSLSNSLLFKF